MHTLQASQFKARCLGLLKQVRRTGDPITVTLRGQPLALICPCTPTPKAVSVAQTLAELRLLLNVEEPEFVPPPRRNWPGARPSIND